MAWQQLYWPHSTHYICAIFKYETEHNLFIKVFKICVQHVCTSTRSLSLDTSAAVCRSVFGGAWAVAFQFSGCRV